MCYLPLMPYITRISLPYFEGEYCVISLFAGNKIGDVECLVHVYLSFNALLFTIRRLYSLTIRLSSTLLAEYVTVSKFIGLTVLVYACSVHTFTLAASLYNQ